MTSDASCSLYRACVFHSTISKVGVNAGNDEQHLTASLVRWNYSTHQPSEVLYTTSQGKHKPDTGSTHSFVICFPGDRLPTSLRDIPDAKLTVPEQNEVATFLCKGCSSTPSIPSHVLDLQEPEAISSMLVAAFPHSPPPFSTTHISHYLVVFGENITSEGFSVYSQLFDEGILQPSGEPKKGSYIAGARRRSLEVINSLMNYFLGSPSTSQHTITSIDFVGFSKGCTALNQLVADIGQLDTEDVQTTNTSEGSEGTAWTLGVHYVDGGLNSAGAFICDRQSLEQFRETFLKTPPPVGVPLLPSFSRLLLSTCSHVTYDIYSTPRQRMDPHRPYLDYERRMMATHLCGVRKVEPATIADGGAFTIPTPSFPAYFTVKTHGIDGAPDTRDWATTTLKGTNGRDTFRVRVLEDIPPPETRADRDEEVSPAIMGLKQHMLAMVRFGEKV